jgi:hypothetical protein
MSPRRSDGPDSSSPNSKIVTVPLRAALLTTLFFWLFHVPSTYVETRSWATTALVLGIFLLPHLGSRLITGWLYNSTGCSVLIAGLFHNPQLLPPASPRGARAAVPVLAMRDLNDELFDSSPALGTAQRLCSS